MIFGALKAESNFEKLQNAVKNKPKVSQVQAFIQHLNSVYKNERTTVTIQTTTLNSFQATTTTTLSSSLKNLKSKIDNLNDKLLLTSANPSNTIEVVDKPQIENFEITEDG